MTNEYHASYWNMKPSANLDAAVLSKVTTTARIAILAISCPSATRCAWRKISRCWTVTRGGGSSRALCGAEPWRPCRRASIHREPCAFEEAHDLILRCWPTPGPFRWEGRYYHHRVVNPWVLPLQKPHPPIWFPGGSSPESVVWAARHRYTYINLGALMDLTREFEAGVY